MKADNSHDHCSACADKTLISEVVEESSIR